MTDLSGEEIRLLDRLNESPTMEGAEVFELISGGFPEVQQTLKHLEEQGMISIKGSYADEKDLFYSTIFRQLLKKK